MDYFSKSDNDPGKIRKLILHDRYLNDKISPQGGRRVNPIYGPETSWCRTKICQAVIRNRADRSACERTRPAVARP